MALYGRYASSNTIGRGVLWTDASCKDKWPKMTVNPLRRIAAILHYTQQVIYKGGRRETNLLQDWHEETTRIIRCRTLVPDCRCSITNFTSPCVVMLHLSFALKILAFIDIHLFTNRWRHCRVSMHALHFEASWKILTCLVSWIHDQETLCVVEKSVFRSDKRTRVILQIGYSSGFFLLLMVKPSLICDVTSPGGCNDSNNYSEINEMMRWAFVCFSLRSLRYT